MHLRAANEHSLAVGVMAEAAGDDLGGRLRLILADDV